MRSLPKLGASVAVALWCTWGIANRASADIQDFTLVNETGAELNNLYASETGTNLWSQNILQLGTLANGAQAEISFSNATACVWDLQVVDTTGAAIVWRAIDLCTYEVVVLHCAQGICWATFD